MTSNTVDLMCADGGIIGKNPSKLGGTWAYVLVLPSGETIIKGGVILPNQLGVEKVTNNQTEMYALLMGLAGLPRDFTGIVMSDSMVSLGRLFLGYKWNNIPPVIHSKFREVCDHLRNWEYMSHTLLDGHPTKAQLEAGYGKRGNPVSIYNVMCDNLCRQYSKDFMKGLEDVNR